MSKVLVKNEGIYYNRIGNEKADKSLVFIPGSGMTAELMGRFAEHFDEYNTVVVELPGHGQSEGEVKESVEELTACIEELIRKLCKEKVLTQDITVLGYSLGGFVAVSLGLVGMPEIKKIVVISSCADLVTNPLGKMLFQVTSIDPDQVYDQMCGSSTPQEKVKALKAMFLEDLRDADLLFKDLYSARNFDIIPKVSQIKKPVLIVIGDEDKVIQPKDAEHLAQLVEGAQLIQYKGFGHGMLFENTAQVVKDIKGFVK